MEIRLPLDILPQPDNTTCGPTCLHALYRYYHDERSLPQVIAETPRLPNGGTLAVLLACHALRSGYKATIYTYNLQIFDPTWFAPGAPDLRQRLQAQSAYKTDETLRCASAAYVEFLDRGGRLRFEDLRPRLIRQYLRRAVPLLTGLSATYLYSEARAFGPGDEPDDIRGVPSGHFVVLCGYDQQTRQVLIADPLHTNPMAKTHVYAVSIDRVICAILLGILTYDANFLIIEPRQKLQGERRAHSHCRE
jgi:hypothetical protein